MPKETNDLNLLKVLSGNSLYKFNQKFKKFI